MMQRYSLTRSGVCDCMYKDDNGKWVQFEEATALLAESEARYSDVCTIERVDLLKQLLAERDAEIKELKYDLSMAIIAEQTCVECSQEFNKMEQQLAASQQQVAELQQEVERLNSPDYYACACCPDIEAARKQAAMEIEQHLLSMFWTIPYKENESMIYRDQAIELIRITFGLEG